MSSQEDAYSAASISDNFDRGSISESSALLRYLRLQRSKTVATSKPTTRAPAAIRRAGTLQDDEEATAAASEGFC